MPLRPSSALCLVPWDLRQRRVGLSSIKTSCEELPGFLAFLHLTSGAEDRVQDAERGDHPNQLSYLLASRCSVGVAELTVWVLRVYSHYSVFEFTQ